MCAYFEIVCANTKGYLVKYIPSADHHSPTLGLDVKTEAVRDRADELAGSLGKMNKRKNAIRTRRWRGPWLMCNSDTAAEFPGKSRRTPPAGSVAPPRSRVVGV